MVNNPKPFSFLSLSLTPAFPCSTRVYAHIVRMLITVRPVSASRVPKSFVSIKWANRDINEILKGPRPKRSCLMRRLRGDRFSTRRSWWGVASPIHHSPQTETYFCAFLYYSAQVRTQFIFHPKPVGNKEIEYWKTSTDFFKLRNQRLEKSPRRKMKSKILIY
jgi:hypothetical protein